MIQISRTQLKTLSARLAPERQSLFAWHVLKTGNGLCFVDSWPEPRALLVTVGRMCSLLGDARALAGVDLTQRLGGIAFVPAAFVPLLQAAFPDMRAIDRVVYELQIAPPLRLPAPLSVRRLQAADAPLVARLDADLQWIGGTWGGPAGLAASGYAWAVFDENRPVAIACSFLVGRMYEDIGVVTEAAYRGRGLAVAAAAQLCRDIERRGRRVSWTTSTDNPASIRVAEKLGFTLQAEEKLYLLK